MPPGPAPVAPAAAGPPGAGGGPRRLLVGPFNRVEGDLDVSLDIDAGVIVAARVQASLYRGFENMLRGRDPYDALVLVPRICGICSVSQSAAAAAALGALCGATPPPNGQRAANLVLASEVIADHLTHFYLFFMPDLARADYAAHRWHADIAARFTALKGSAAAAALPARAGLLRVLATLAGKWPHTLALRPGGTTRVLHPGERGRLKIYLAEFRAFVERQLLGDRIENFAALDSADALDRWAAGRDADLPRFLACAADIGLDALGRAGDLYLSGGAYPGGGVAVAGTMEPVNNPSPRPGVRRGDRTPGSKSLTPLGSGFRRNDETDVPQRLPGGASGDFLFPAGVLDLASGTRAPFDPSLIREDHRFSRFADSAEPLPPAVGRTEPDVDKADAYSWCKAPRYAGRVPETGALARQLVAGNPLAVDLVRRHAGRVVARMVARQIEIARLLLAMEAWTAAIVDREPFFAPPPEMPDGHAAGFVEAARGTLGHWLGVERGRIAHYQIVAPTTWNFSPRDAAGQPGPLEQALVGLPVAPGDSAPVNVQHVVRSFDPCMVCTVH